MTGRLVRRALVVVGVLACALTVVSVAAPPEPTLVPAADTRSFQADNIISDAVF